MENIPMPKPSRTVPPLPARHLRLGLPVAILLCALVTCVQANDGTKSQDAAIGAKLGGSIECINSHSHWVLKSRERYLSWIKSPQAGPTGKEAIVYGLYKLNDVSSCRSGLEKAAAMAPSIPAFEQAMSTWMQAFLAADIVVTEADTYYELQNYNDDRMQLGKTLHPRLLAVYAEFERADDALRAIIEETKDGLTVRRLERLANDPQQRVSYLADRLLRDADLMFRSADGLGGKGFDSTSLSASVASFEVAWSELSDHRKANPDDRREVIRSSSFVDAGFALLKSAKAAERRARNGTPLDESEQMLAGNGAAQLVDGHPQQLLEKYNDLIDVANRTRW